MKAYILAGGTGSRLAPNKGLLQVGGVSIVERVIAAAAPLVTETVLVGPAEQLTQVGLRTVTEAQSGVTGPLGGLCAALADATPGDALILPWDAPFLATSALQFLVEARGAADAAVPRRGRYVEPLFAVYAARCLGPAEEALQRGDRRVVSFYSEVAIRWVHPEELSRFGDWETLFLNINTPGDLARARKMAAEGGNEP